MLYRAIVRHELRQAGVEPSRRETSKIGCRQAERNPSEQERTSQINLQRALEKLLGSSPRSSNGRQFIAQDFKEFVGAAGLNHVRPRLTIHQSNGKIKHWHKSLKADCIRSGTPLDIEQASASSLHTSSTTTPCTSTPPLDSSPR